jgi:hypothetical protein
MIDRYSKIILTLIAGALIYLCIVMTAFPAVSAQGTQRPGEPSGPLEVVVVGWKSTTPLSIAAQQPIRVITERVPGAAERVVVVGWEENAAREAPATMHGFNAQSPGIPVVVRPAK